MHSAGQDLGFIAYHNIDIFLAFILFVGILVWLLKNCCCSSSAKAPQIETKNKEEDKLSKDLNQTTSPIQMYDVKYGRISREVF